MKQYDVDVEFEILFTIMNSLREYDFVTNEHNKKCIAYVSDKITNLMNPEPKLDPLTQIRNTCDNFFDSIHPKPPAIVPKNPPEDYMDGAIPANEEIYFVPDDSEYEFYSASMDDVIEKPKRSDVIL